MKWYQGLVKGGAQRYMDVSAQERAYAAEQSLKDIDTANAAAASMKKNTKKFGNLTFQWRDPSDIAGGDWQEKNARVDDFKGFLKENFYTDNTFDSSKWDSFKSNDGVAADAIKDEWNSSLKAWLYPNPSVVEGVGTQSFNTYDYSWLEGWDEMHDIATAIDKPRETGSFTGVTQFEKNGKIVNTEELFDVIDNFSKTTKPEDAVVRPDDKIHLNVDDENSMINVMLPVFRNQQYGGGTFRSDEEYYTRMKENPHHLFIGNALWNMQNEREGWGRNRTYDEIAQIAIFYNKTHDEVIDSMNHLSKKFEVGGQKTSQRTVTEFAKVTQSERSKATAAIDANDRVQYLADSLISAYEDLGLSGGSLNIFNALEGIFGKTGQIKQVGMLLGAYDEVKKEGGIDEDASIFKNQLQQLQKDYQDSTANNNDVSNAVAIKYLEITLAFNLALAEQGGGGGRAISDQDFKYALERVGKGFWNSTEQSIQKLKLLKKIATKDFIGAQIKSSNKYTSTHSALTEHWMGYKEGFDRVKQDYIRQLQGNYVFGELRETKDGPIKDSFFAEKEVLENGVKTTKIVKTPYLYNGRLSALMAYDFGERPDVDIRDREAQGLWAMATDAEKAVLRPNAAALENLDNLILGSGYKSKKEQLDIIAKEAAQNISTPVQDVNPYDNPDWWGTSDTWKDKTTQLQLDRRIEQEKLLEHFDTLLSSEFSEIKGNIGTKFMDMWRKDKGKEGAEKSINQYYRYFTDYYDSHFFDSYRIKLKENNSQIIPLMNSIKYMDTAITRKGPPQQ